MSDKRQSDRQQFSLTLRDEWRSGAPATVRMRRALITLLRGFGLRCVAISPEAGADTSPPTPGTPQESPARPGTGGTSSGRPMR